MFGMRRRQERARLWYLRMALMASALCCGLAATPAFAVATANISAGWDAYFQLYQDSSGQLGPLPAGVTISCVGAVPFAVNGCQSGGTLSASNASATPETFVVTYDGILRVTNNSPNAVGGDLVFITDFSSFLPGSLGVTVSDPAREFASFSSTLFGPDVEDMHSCMTTAILAACGVSSPDFSTTSFVVGIPGPGQSVNEGYNGSINAELIGVPEPPAWSYFVLLIALPVLLRKGKWGAFSIAGLWRFSPKA